MLPGAKQPRLGCDNPSPTVGKKVSLPSTRGACCGMPTEQLKEFCPTERQTGSLSSIAWPSTCSGIFRPYRHTGDAS